MGEGLSVGGAIYEGDYLWEGLSMGFYGMQHPNLYWELATLKK